MVSRNDFFFLGVLSPYGEPDHARREGRTPTRGIVVFASTLATAAMRAAVLRSASVGGAGALPLASYMPPDQDRRVGRVATTPPPAAATDGMLAGHCERPYASPLKQGLTVNVAFFFATGDGAKYGADAGAGAGVGAGVYDAVRRSPASYQLTTPFALHVSSQRALSSQRSAGTCAAVLLRET